MVDPHLAKLRRAQLPDELRDMIFKNILKASAIIRSYQTYDNLVEVKAALEAKANAPE